MPDNDQIRAVHTGRLTNLETRLAQEEGAGADAHLNARLDGRDESTDLDVQAADVRVKILTAEIEKERAFLAVDVAVLDDAGPVAPVVVADVVEPEKPTKK